MRRAMYNELLKFYNGIEHADEISNVRVSNRASVNEAVVAALCVAAKRLACNASEAGFAQLTEVWTTAAKVLPLLLERTMVADRVAAQRDLLSLLYCLAGATAEIVNTDPLFEEERGRQLVAIRPLEKLMKGAGIGSNPPALVLREIGARLSAIARWRHSTETGM